MEVNDTLVCVGKRSVSPTLNGISHAGIIWGDSKGEGNERADEKAVGVIPMANAKTAIPAMSKGIREEGPCPERGWGKNSLYNRIFCFQEETFRFM
jgi:hypothetical protein